MTRTKEERERAQARHIMSHEQAMAALDFAAIATSPDPREALIGNYCRKRGLLWDGKVPFSPDLTGLDEVAKVMTSIHFDGVRDWIEDAGHENGCYFCKCHKCGQQFIGHKRRITCRVCHDIFAEQHDRMVAFGKFIQSYCETNAGETLGVPDMEAMLIDFYAGYPYPSAKEDGK